MVTVACPRRVCLGSLLNFCNTAGRNRNGERGEGGELVVGGGEPGEARSRLSLAPAPTISRLFNSTRLSFLYQVSCPFPLASPSTRRQRRASARPFASLQPLSLGFCTSQNGRGSLPARSVLYRPTSASPTHPLTDLSGSALSTPTCILQSLPPPQSRA